MKNIDFINIWSPLYLFLAIISIYYYYKNNRLLVGILFTLFILPFIAFIISIIISLILDKLGYNVQFNFH